MTKDDIIEQLAAIEHERWAAWQSWVHNQGHRTADGNLVLSAGTVARWERQIATTYADLSEQEKESDREQVRRYWGILHPYLNGLADDAQ
jgi:hypothetical protein